MKILALDTATAVAAIAVMEDDKPLAEIALETGRKRGEVMAEAVAGLLQRLELRPHDLEAYALGIGPGSFTGLRSSLAFIKGLALTSPRPVVGVSTLHSLALSAVDFKGLVLPVIDARKGEVFTARFRADGRGAVQRESQDVALTPDRILEMIDGPALLLGDALLRYRALFEQGLKPNAIIALEKLWAPRAINVAALARPRLQNGESDRIDTLVPIYVRASDAELSLGPRR